SEMLGSRREFSPHLTRFLLKAALYGSLVLGLFPFIFDLRKCQLIRNRWLLFYGQIVHFLLMSLLGYHAIWKPEALQALEVNPVLNTTYLITGIMEIFLAVVIYFTTFWGCDKVQKIANELLTLEYRYFEGQNENNCPKFNRYVIQKSLITLGQLLSVLVLNYAMPANKASIILVIFYCVIKMVMNLNNMHYYTGVLFIYRYVWTINGQLQDQADQFKENPLENCSRIRELLCLYERLLELSGKLVAAYEIQMTLMITVGLLSNIAIIYFLIVFGISLGETSIFLMVVFYSLLINIYDFWLNIVVFDLTENTGRETSSVLKLFTGIEQKDVELERSLNEFAWLCSHRKFRFRLNGILSINYKMGFQMIVTSFLYLIYLVQFDYMNL
ncbi:hypothetical protein KR084_006712, partial [Drosophila pseudotakahashii]